MIHKMKLVDFAFQKIKNKEKDIEVRLNDEKRQLINVGDVIEFTHIDTQEVLKVRVKKLHKYKTFKELFDTFPHQRFGLKETDTEKIMDNFYNKEEQEKYGALGIEIELL